MDFCRVPKLNITIILLSLFLSTSSFFSRRRFAFFPVRLGLMLTLSSPNFKRKLIFLLLFDYINKLYGWKRDAHNGIIKRTSDFDFGENAVH